MDGFGFWNGETSRLFEEGGLDVSANDQSKKLNEL